MLKAKKTRKLSALFPPHSSDSPCVWYIRQGRKLLSWNYMFALLHCSVLESKGVEAIPHLAPEPEYTRLVDMVFDRKPRATAKVLANLAFEADDGDGTFGDVQSAPAPPAP
eukprot:1368614-Alexandrium_andersonii.AAC.1